MRFSKQALGLAAVGVAIAASLAACSSTGTTTPSAGASTPADTGTFASGDPGTLVFAAVPDSSGSVANWQPLVDYVAKKTGLKVTTAQVASYSALEQAAAAGQVDFGAFSGATYIGSVAKGATLKVISAVDTEPGATDPLYYSEAIVPANSSITDVKGFAGQTVCFVSPSSTSGFFLPMNTLQQAGIDVSSTGTDANKNPIFSAFTAYFAGAHDKSVAAVASGQCTAGFAEDAEAEPAAAAGQIKILSKTAVPGGPIVINTALPQSVQDQLTSLLSNLTVADITAAGITVTDGFKSGFVYAKAEDASFYDAVKGFCSIPVVAPSC